MVTPHMWRVPDYTRRLLPSRPCAVYRSYGRAGSDTLLSLALSLPMRTYRCMCARAGIHHWAMTVVQSDCRRHLYLSTNLTSTRVAGPLYPTAAEYDHAGVSHEIQTSE